MRRLAFSPFFLLLAACSGGGSGDNRPVQMATDLPVAETVNGNAVPQALLEALAKAHNMDLA